MVRSYVRWLLILLWTSTCFQSTYGQAPTFIDCSLLVAPDYPATWPTAPFPRFQITFQQTIGPDSAYNIDTLLIDGNTGTQLDVPPHSVARPDLKRPKSSPLGLAYTDRIQPWQFGGEACVIDIRDLLNQAPNGTSPLVLTKHVQQFERQHRPLHFGDVVLFRSDYTDRYYRPFPAGQRYISDILDGKAPGYPNPDPACMEFLATRNVMTLGTDSASMGPLPDLAEPTHYAGLKHGMIWTEAATNLGSLPSTGAFYIMLYPRHKDGAYSEGRAFAIAGGTLPARLIASATAKRAVDLSPVMAQGYPLTSPGSATGRHRQVYLDVNFLYSEYLDMWHHTHLLDSMAGTHLVPPSFSLPASEKPVQYAPHIRGWLEEYEKKFGKRGTSSMTTEKVPLEWTCGEARVIDVRHLVGSVNQRHWPASPVVTVAHIKAYEAQHGDLKGGDIVIFQTGHIDRYYQPAPADQFLWIDPQSGKSEGWPAPNPETIFYLKDRGIRCVATDAPTLGGVDEKQALMTYWALGSNAMVGVEFLYQVDQIPANSYFLFAAVKIRDCHGGLGRAIVLH